MKILFYTVVCLITLVLTNGCQTAIITSQASNHAINPNSKIYISVSPVRSIENQNIEAALNKWFSANRYKLVSTLANADYIVSYNTGDVTTIFNQSTVLPDITRTNGSIGSNQINVTQTGYKEHQYQQAVTNRTLSLEITDANGKHKGDTVWEGGVGTFQDKLINQTQKIIDNLMLQIGTTAKKQIIL